jgi:hypothetical protein
VIVEDGDLVRAGQLSGRPIKNLISAARHCKFAYLKDFLPSAMQICSAIFDLGNGSTDHLSWDVVERATKQGSR